MDLSNKVAPLISVIVPIYHSEAYLERCCKSIFGQTYDALEILLIVDGPSEEAEKILSRVLEEYAHRKNQVRLILHRENKGISYCRQEGFDLSTGDFIYYCDSDDWLELVAFEVLCRTAVEQQSDLVYFDYIRHYDHGNKDVVYSSSVFGLGVVNTADGTLQNKLIHRALIADNAIRFPIGINWGEDLCVSILLQILATRISYVPQILYHYCIHEGSITTDVTIEKYEQLVACPRFIEKELHQRGKLNDYAMMVLQHKFESKVYYLIHPKIRDFSRWLSIYPECHSHIWHFSGIPFYLKCVSWMVVHRMPKTALCCLRFRDLYHHLRN